MPNSGTGTPRHVPPMHKPLRARLTLWTAVVSVLLHASAAAIYLVYERETLDHAASTALIALAPSLAADPATTTGAISRSYHLRPVNDLIMNEGWKRTIDALQSASGSSTAVRHHWPDGNWPSNADNMARSVLVKSPEPGAPDLVLSTDDAAFELSAAAAGDTVLFCVCASILATSLAAWLISGIAMAPLRELHVLLDSLAPERIREKIPVPHTSTETLQFKHDLAEARERLRQAFQAQDRLISNASHELKTPIAVLITEAETITPSELSPEAMRFVTSVREEMRRLGTTIENLTMLSKLRSGRLTASPRVSSVNEFVMDAVANSVPFATRRGVTLRPHLAESASPPLVAGEPHLLRTMIEHLLSNSIRASKRGDEVSITVVEQETSCLITVNDQGSGIPLELLSTLFDRYTDPDGPCSDRRDLGLGISLGIAELHGGRVVASSYPEGGCRFDAELPLAGNAAIRPVLLGPPDGPTPPSRTPTPAG